MFHEFLFCFVVLCCILVLVWFFCVLVSFFLLSLNSFGGISKVF